MKLEIIERRTIKPSSPTPDHLKYFNLSLLDQLSPSIFAYQIFFYTNNNSHTDDHQFNVDEKSEILKSSLSKALTYFYPFAGRVNTHSTVECNDEGVDYIQVLVDCSLSSILENQDVEVLQRLLPIDPESAEASTGSLLLVQANFFNSGGMAIGLCISHKVADGSSFCNFARDWANIAANKPIALPEFIAATLFPPIESSVKDPPREESDLTVEDISQKSICKRFVFSSSKIEALKAKLVKEGTEQPTRVEAVSALIWKCAMEASRSTSGLSKPSFLAQIVSLRKRFVPPLPETSVGNLWGYFVAQAGGYSAIELHDLATKLRNGIREFGEKYTEKLKGEDRDSFICDALKLYGNLSKRDEIEGYYFTSWCRFPLYETDFGWGKPIWVGQAYFALKNLILLMDSSEGDGIEAWVCLTEEQMALFRCNKELLAYAAIN